MLGLKLPPATDSRALPAIVEQALAMKQRFGSRAANQLLIDQVGVEVLSTLNEPYCAAALDYHLGLVFAGMGEAERAAEAIERSGVLPGTGGNLIFSDHVAESLEIHRRQQAARERGLPTFLIAAMPRSASATLTQTIARTLDLPHARASVGTFPVSALVLGWLNACTPGGIVLHDHLGGSAHNVRVLRSGNVRSIMVLIRDPRAAALSRWRLAIDRNCGNPGESIDAGVLGFYLSSYIPWLSEWIAVARDPACGIRVDWLFYTATHNNLAAAVKQVFGLLREQYPVLTEFADRPPVVVNANFVEGDDTAWRRVLSEETRQRMWAAIPREAVELLELSP